VKPFKTRSKPILKRIAINKFGEITLKILKGKSHKVDKNESPFRYFNYVPIGHKKINK
jgi:hypothetical protein